MDPLSSETGENYFLKQPFKVYRNGPNGTQQMKNTSAEEDLLKLSENSESLQYLN